VLTSSRKVDNCKPLTGGIAAAIADLEAKEEADREKARRARAMLDPEAHDVVRKRQGLQLVYFSAQPEPLLVAKITHYPTKGAYGELKSGRV